MKPLLFLILLISSNAQAETEKYYQDKFCRNIGIMEVMLKDRTRVDCMTLGMAIEVGFANKWAQDIGQALHYSLMTGKHPGIATIVVSDKDCKYLIRLRRILSAVKPIISLWEIGPYAYKCIYK